MGTVPLSEKSSVEEIRSRFDNDVERFSILETGQSATIDAPLVLELVAKTAGSHLQPEDALLDIGCGAGNFTLRVLKEISPLHCTIVDLSNSMLERAGQRIQENGFHAPAAIQSDVRELNFAPNSFDCILAGAVLHHLREEADWYSVFKKLHTWLKPNGHLYVSDLVRCDQPEVNSLMWNHYSEYLIRLGGTDYRDRVLAYIEKEDSPRSLPFQIELLQKVGFQRFEILHRHSVFACYFGIKGASENLR